MNSEQSMQPEVIHDERAGPSADWSVADTLLGLLSLIRPLNAAIAIVAILAAGYIAAPGAVDWGRLCLGALAGVLIGSSGNVLNDILDVGIDRINRPLRALPSRKVGIAAAWVLFLATASLGLLASGFLGQRPFAFSAAAAVLIILYDFWLKKIPLVGNGVVGLLTGSAMVYGALVAGSMSAGILPGLFAFLTNTTREIVKDMEDVAGDSAHGVRTFPARAGMRASRTLVTAAMIIISVTTPVPWLLGSVRTPYLVITLAGIVPLLIFLTFVLQVLPEKKAIRIVSAGLKAIMILGILAFMLGTGGVK